MLYNIKGTIVPYNPKNIYIPMVNVYVIMSKVKTIGTSIIRSQNKVTLPSTVLQSLGLQIGDIVVFEQVDNENRIYIRGSVTE